MVTEETVSLVIRTSRPTFRNAADKVAFAVHASFLAAGYVLHCTGPPAFVDDALSSSSTDEVGIDHWNEFEDNYAFVYSKTDKDPKKVLVKCLAMNGKLLVDVLRDGDKEPLHLEIGVEEYVGENGGSNYSLQYKNLGKLVGLIDKEILGKLSGTSGPSAQSSSSEDKGGLRDDTGLRDDRGRHGVGIADTEDPYFYDPSGVFIPPLPGSGGSDLFPGPGAGMYPQRGDFGAGGMLVGPNDPRFFGGLGGERGLPGRGGQPGVPPGARFDPYGPPGVPGFEPGRFVRGPRRPGGGTHPDLEHFGGGGDFI